MGQTDIKCNTCDETKRKEEFYSNGSGQCKECNKAYQRAYYRLKQARKGKTVGKVGRPKGVNKKYIPKPRPKKHYTSQMMILEAILVKANRGGLKIDQCDITRLISKIHQENKAKMG